MKLFLFLLVPTLGLAAIVPNPIPRSASQEWAVHPNFWQGGEKVRVDLSEVNIQFTPSRIRERWTFGFHGRPAAVPVFRLRYHGEEDPRFVLSLRNIRENKVTVGRLQSLVKHSQLISKITAYPPIQGGDMVVEIKLKEPIAYWVHHPRETPAKLVFDLVQARRQLH